MPRALYLQDLGRRHYDLLLPSACSNAAVLSLVPVKSCAFADLDFEVENAKRLDGVLVLLTFRGIKTTSPCGSICNYKMKKGRDAPLQVDRMAAGGFVMEA